MSLKDKYNYLKKYQNKQSILVISHERSGTHFLMNSLEKCFLYDSYNFINFDVPEININYFHKPSIEKSLNNINKKYKNKLVKSHHPFDFFNGILNNINLKIIYIYRNPLYVMRSLRVLNNSFEWFESPYTNNISEFIRTIPQGRCTRYQYRYENNFLTRWKTHVDEWTLQNNILKIKFEQLKDNFEKTIYHISEFLNVEPFEIQKPPKNYNVINPNNQIQKYEKIEDQYKNKDYKFIRNELHQTLNYLNYSI